MTLRGAGKRWALAATGVAGLLVTMNIPAAGSAAAAGRPTTLASQLAERDAAIARLEKRVEELERRLEDFAAKRPAAASASGQAEPAPPAMPVGQAATAQTASPPATPAPDAAPGMAHNSGPASFTVDKEAAERALERTLTQTGALLLLPRQYQLSPNMTYTRREQTVPALVGLTDSGGDTVNQLADQQVRRDEVLGALDLKIGLPHDAQLEFGIPYSHVNESRLLDLGYPNRVTSSNNGGSWGDVTLGVAKTLAHQDGWRPDLIGRVTYNTGSGKRLDNAVTLNQGFRQIGGQLVALARQDPLAFVGALSYSRSFEEDSIRPGDQFGFSLSTLLASSPQTSLQFGFSQTFQDKTELGGVAVPGSDLTQGILSIGASSVLARNSILNFQLGVGLGRDAPKYYFQLSLPITFGP